MLSLYSHSLRTSRFTRPRIGLFSTVEGAGNVAKPETKKEKVVEKWINFWKLLLRDYRDVFFETGKQMKEHQLKSTLWLSSIAFASICCYLNPDEIQYRECIVRRSNELIFIGKLIRNPNADEYLRTIESYFNTGEIKRISFGIFSVILRDYKCRNSALFKDNCSYVQPTYSEIVKDHVVDIGFWNQWWFLEKAMEENDINPNEWT